MGLNTFLKSYISELTDLVATSAALSAIPNILGALLRAVIRALYLILS
jgi:hypothetical protein